MSTQSWGQLGFLAILARPACMPTVSFARSFVLFNHTLVLADPGTRCRGLTMQGHKGTYFKWVYLEAKNFSRLGLSPRLTVPIRVEKVGMSREQRGVGAYAVPSGSSARHECLPGLLRRPRCSGWMLPKYIGNGVARQLAGSARNGHAIAAIVIHGGLGNSPSGAGGLQLTVGTRASMNDGCSRRLDRRQRVLAKMLESVEVAETSAE